MGTADARAPEACARLVAGDQVAVKADDRDVIPWLRQLGFSVAEARRAAARCEENPDASLEQRVRFALSCIGVRGTRFGPTGERLTATPVG